jgi:hypothetical protein
MMSISFEFVGIILLKDFWGLSKDVLFQPRFFNAWTLSYLISHTYIYYLSFGRFNWIELSRYVFIQDIVFAI